MTEDKKPSARPTLTLKGKAPKPAPASTGAPETPAKPIAPPQPPRVKGPAYTPPKRRVERMEVFWMVMRDNGRRPQKRHTALEDAQEEAKRIAASCPGSRVWVLQVQTIEEHTGAAADAPAAPTEGRSSG